MFPLSNYSPFLLYDLPRGYCRLFSVMPLLLPPLFTFVHPPFRLELFLLWGQQLPSSRGRGGEAEVGSVRKA